MIAVARFDVGEDGFRDRVRDVGSYRRALGKLDVRMRAALLLAEAADEPGAFEELVTVAAGRTEIIRESDREPGSDVS